MNAWNTPPNNPWENPRSYAPNLEDQLAAAEYYEKLARRARRDAEIGDALRLLAWGVGSALLLVVGMVYYGMVS